MSKVTMINGDVYTRREYEIIRIACNHSRLKNGYVDWDRLINKIIYYICVIAAGGEKRLASLCERMHKTYVVCIERLGD